MNIGQYEYFFLSQTLITFLRSMTEGLMTNVESFLFKVANLLFACCIGPVKRLEKKQQNNLTLPVLYINY